ncbi:MAG: hypothetical protein PHU85_00135 [Phycisphaerae bacterium]|nr:hypothetical protein [Phycisphaerae bacterium]
MTLTFTVSGAEDDTPDPPEGGGMTEEWDWTDLNGEYAYAPGDYGTANTGNNYCVIASTEPITTTVHGRYKYWDENGQVTNTEEFEEECDAVFWLTKCCTGSGYRESLFIVGRGLFFGELRTSLLEAETQDPFDCRALDMELAPEQPEFWPTSLQGMTVSVSSEVAG